VTSKFIVQGELSFEKRDFRGDPGIIPGLATREDDFRQARLTLSYTPIRNVELSLSYENGDRRSNNVVNSFDYQSWFGTIRVSF
jgi:hypothetical protein